MRILMRQEMTGFGMALQWLGHTICKQSAPSSRQTTMQTTSSLIFYRPDALPDAQPTESKH